MKEAREATLRQRARLGVDASSNRFPSPAAGRIWLFGFLKIDLDAITPGKSLDLRQEAMDFVEVVNAGPLIDVEPGNVQLDGDNLPSVAVLHQVQDDFQSGLSRLRRGEPWMLDNPIRSGIRRAGDEIIRAYRQAPFRDLFVAAIHDILEDNWSQLRQCPRCTNVFLKVRKQAYCSTECSRKMRWDRFKSKRTSRDHSREREHALRKRLGPKARVKVVRRDKKSH